MLFPRLIAFSEVVWSPKEKREWKDFEKKLPVVFGKLEAQGINYSKAFYDIKTTVTRSQDDSGIVWQLETKSVPIKNLVINLPAGKDSMDVPVYDSIGNEVGKKRFQNTDFKDFHNQDRVTIPIKYSGDANAVLLKGNIPFGMEIV
jgi:hypothetical protein